MADTRFHILVAEHAGVCYGVERALNKAYEAAGQATAPVNTLGPLIHNPRVVLELEDAGVGLAESLSDCKGGTVVVRAHGVVPQTIEDARDRGLEVVDATCPYVKKVHHAASRLSAEGYQVLVVGESGHPEVEGIMGHAGQGPRVVSDVEDIAGLELGDRVGVVVQTTQTDERLAQVAAALVARCREVRVVNTICKATHERQQSAAALACSVDAMIVIGGKNSGNTRRLYQICAESCARTYHIESSDELDPAWFDACSRVGVTAGASTPAAHINQVIELLREFGGSCDE